MATIPKRKVPLKPVFRPKTFRPIRASTIRQGVIKKPIIDKSTKTYKERPKDLVGWIKYLFAVSESKADYKYKIMVGIVLVIFGLILIILAILI